MKIFVINMARATERRVTILRHLDELGLEAEILPAVEGAKIERSTLGPDAEPGLSAGEIGCYLSHIRFWQIVVERQLEHAIVLEDDVICEPAMMTVAEEIASLKLPVDAVRLSALQPIRGRTIARLSGGHSLLLPNKNPSGTQGYMVSLQGARHLLQVLSVPKLPIDNALDAYWKHGLCVPIVSPSLVAEDASIASTIGGRFGSTMPWSLRRHLTRVAEAQRRKITVYLMALRLKSRLHNARDSQTVAR